MLEWNRARFAVTDRLFLSIDQLLIPSAACVCFVGANGSGKTLLAKALCGELPQLSGQAPHMPSRVRLSFEQQQALIEEDWRRRNTDMAGEEEELGFTVEELLLAELNHHERMLVLADRLGIRHLLSRPYRFLSSGEGRKVLLAQALMAKPELLVLDEPFDGLDSQAQTDLKQILNELHEAGQTLVLIVNRLEEIPSHAQQVGLLNQANLIMLGEAKQLTSHPELASWLAMSTQAKADWPAPAQTPAEPEWPLVRLRKLRIQYDDHLIIRDLDWEIQPGQHWQLVGPNGAGKSTLLSVITGDHPQGYANDVTLFGRQRGSGESIWDIKKHIGYVSPALHLDYRVRTTALNVILSGYFDSIGLYETAGDQLVRLAQQWLNRLGLDTQARQPFHDLSFGQQRLLLIARALVKHPKLLILDEPLQGLDPFNRELVRHAISDLMQSGRSQILFVSHHQEDAPPGLTHRLSFVPAPDGGYTYLQEPLTDKEKA